MLKLTIITIVVLLSLPSWHQAAFAHGSSGKTSRAKIGDGFAVQAFDADQGFQLSAAASQRMKIQLIDYHGEKPFTLPTAAIVRVKGAPEIFRVRDGWIKAIPVKTIAGKNGITVQPGTGLRTGDKIVVAGAPLLRVTDLDLRAGANSDVHETPDSPPDHDKEHDQDHGQEQDHGHDEHEHGHEHHDEEEEHQHD